MNRLTANKLEGIWAGLPISWDEKYLFDEKSYAQNIERMCKTKVHGLYTTGSSGEFYALDYEEFCRMADIVCEICNKYKKPLQIGCCSDATRKTIKLIEYASQKDGVGAVQINLPYWMELTDREVKQFFSDVYKVNQDMPLIHYNIPRAKRFLNGCDYLQILEIAPSLIGVKYCFAGSNFSDLQHSIRITPQLSYFVGESLLASAVMMGARGSYSSFVYTNPDYILGFYENIKAGKWKEAMASQGYIAEFEIELEVFIKKLGEGVIDPVGDKGLGVASGFLKGSQKTRPPYIGWSEETVMRVRQWLKEEYPEFVFDGK